MWRHQGGRGGAQNTSLGGGRREQRHKTCQISGDLKFGRSKRWLTVRGTLILQCGHDSGIKSEMRWACASVTYSEPCESNFLILIGMLNDIHGKGVSLSRASLFLLYFGLPSWRTSAGGLIYWCEGRGQNLKKVIIWLFPYLGPSYDRKPT